MASVLIPRDKQLVFHLLLQLCDMRDDSDHPRVTGHFPQNADCLIPCMIIQRSETFINKHDVQINTGRICADLICHTERQ